MFTFNLLFLGFYNIIYLFKISYQLVILNNIKFNNFLFLFVLVRNYLQNKAKYNIFEGLFLFF